MRLEQLQYLLGIQKDVYKRQALTALSYRYFLRKDV